MASSSTAASINPAFLITPSGTALVTGFSEEPFASSTPCLCWGRDIYATLVEVSDRNDDGADGLSVLEEEEESYGRGKSVQ